MLGRGLCTSLGKSCPGLSSLWRGLPAFPCILWWAHISLSCKLSSASMALILSLYSCVHHNHCLDFICRQDQQVLPFLPETWSISSHPWIDSVLVDETWRGHPSLQILAHLLPGGLYLGSFFINSIAANSVTTMNSSWGILSGAITKFSPMASTAVSSFVNFCFEILTTHFFYCSPERSMLSTPLCLFHRCTPSCWWRRCRHLSNSKTRQHWRHCLAKLICMYSTSNFTS